MAPKPQSFADQIRAEIKRRGLTAYAVAKAAGVSPQTVQRFVRKEHDPSLDNFEKIAAYLGYQLSPRKER